MKCVVSLAAVLAVEYFAIAAARRTVDSVRCIALLSIMHIL